VVSRRDAVKFAAKFAAAFSIIVVLSVYASAQKAPSSVHSGSAEGELTVTMTVVASVGIVMDDQGQPKVIVANAADSGDNVSFLEAASQPHHQSNFSRVEQTVTSHANSEIGSRKAKVKPSKN
jgi:hypothetical protein